MRNIPGKRFRDLFSLAEIRKGNNATYVSRNRRRGAGCFCARLCRLRAKINQKLSNVDLAWVVTLLCREPLATRSGSRSIAGKSVAIFMSSGALAIKLAAGAVSFSWTAGEVKD